MVHIMKEKYKYSVFKHLLKSSFLCILVSRVIKIGSHLSRMSCAFDYCRIVVFQARPFPVGHTIAYIVALAAGATMRPGLDCKSGKAGQ